MRNFFKNCIFSEIKDHSICPKNTTVYIHSNHLLMCITNLFNDRKIRLKMLPTERRIRKDLDIVLFQHKNDTDYYSWYHIFFIQTPTKIFVKKLTAFLEREKILYTADHVINGKTKNPPIQMHFPWPMHWHWKLYQTAAAVVHQTHSRLHF